MEACLESSRQLIQKLSQLGRALNCGTGSSFLKALVNAFDKAPHGP